MEGKKGGFSDRVSGQFNRFVLSQNGNFVKKLKIAIAVLALGVFVTLGIVCIDRQDRRKQVERWRENKKVADSTARAVMDSTIRAVFIEMILPVKEKVDLHDRILYREGITNEPSRPVLVDTQKVYEQIQMPEEKKWKK